MFFILDNWYQNQDTVRISKYNSISVSRQNDEHKKEEGFSFIEKEI